jgi:ubiquinone/menaquinone biosynthesis C-methylase UbiE
MMETPLTSADYYKKATSFWNYPEVPYGPALREIIRPTDVVADLGCGIGVVSRFLAGFCQRVIAVDQDESALMVLNESLNRMGLDNIEVVHARWPHIQTDDWDVALAFYHHSFASTSLEIETLLRKTRRCGIIVTQGIRPREGFYEDLGREFGIIEQPRSCIGSCYVRGRLEQAGFSVTCTEIFHDFGQPVDSKAEAVAYAMRQLRLKEHQRQQLEEVILGYVENVKGQMVLPIKRYNCMLRYYK